MADEIVPAPAAAAAASAVNDGTAAGAAATPNTPAASATAEPKATAAQTPVVPTKYELKLPEGSQLEASHLEKIASFAKERGLSNDQAQAILQRDHEAKVSFEKANRPGGEDWGKRTQAWEKEALADKEIGGTEENLKASSELGRRVLTKFFPESVAHYLVESGLGSHPDIIRGFAKLGKMMSDDQLVVGGKPTGDKKSMEEVFYGSSSKEGA